ncbi:MAG: type II toxin-antitoxin system RelE/ParE family toxin [Limisphaerales bacterium]
MKLKPVEYLPAAQVEAVESAVWYQERESGLGERFQVSLELAEKLIRRNPLLGAPYYLDTRKWRVPDFPFNLIYREEPRKILIVAVAHQARRPGYWRKRISSKKKDY